MTEQTKPTEITPEHIQALFDLMIADYHRWSFSRANSNDTHLMEIKTQMFEEYKAKLRYEVNQKYIRLISDNSVVGFIVNVHDDAKFPFGTLLYPAGWRTAKRNHSRGSIFEPEKSNVKWTGLPTLR